MRALIRCLLFATLLPGQPIAAREIVVSANDGKPVRSGDRPSDLVDDTVATLEVSSAGVRMLGRVIVPASMVGPPESVKITPDGKRAIVSASQQLNSKVLPTLVPGDTVSLIDIRNPATPQVTQRLSAGAGAAGVAINRRGTLVLVANGAADSVSVFTLAGKGLASIGTVALPKGSKPAAIRFARDGRSAIVTGSTAGLVFRLAVNGTRVEATGESIATGRGPSSVTLSRDGRTAFVVNAATGGANAGGTGIVAVVDLVRFRLLGSFPIGPQPEHAVVSPSGRRMLAVLLAGSQLEHGARGRSEHGILKVFRVSGTHVSPLAEIVTGPLCQGAAWSRDERRILLQCAEERVIETYRLEGSFLERDAAPPIPMGGRPGAMAGLRTR